ncbi:MAG TPA: YqhR family membrane protein [Bacillota bacterium]|nr:YqhR family membrane protein [Bacillota bacterium]
MSDDEKKRKVARDSYLSRIRNKALYTGFIGGIMSGTFGYIMYYFNISKVSPKSFVLTSWNHASWTDGKLGIVLSIILIGLLSIVVAFLYFLLLKKVNTIWMGVVFGAILWGIVFYPLHPLFPGVPALTEFESSTIISTLSLYVLYGVFIGYTISYDYAVYRHKTD